MIKTDFKTKRVKVADIIPYENNPRRNEDAVEPVGGFEAFAEWGLIR